MPVPFYQELDFSNKRRTFVVADIHGEFRKFDALLKREHFDEHQDVVISVGDLVDRGPHSEDFENYINKSWFFRTLGNHETQPREYLLGYETAESVSNNGGDWFLAKDKAEQERLATLLEAAPLALKIITPEGRRVGITHADVSSKWDVLSSICQDPDMERYIVNLLTGSRDKINLVRCNGELDTAQIRVRGIDHVFHGHTPVESVTTYANRTWIDTQIDGNSPLTMIDIDVFLDKL